MRMVFDPITDFLNRSAWILWALLWLSLSLGIGQEEFNIPVNGYVPYNTTVASTIAAILLWACVILQATRQIYYSHLGPPLVKLARWIILGATTIFAFRMTYMLAAYGGAASSMATLIGVSLLAIGLSLNAIGMMQQSYFQENGTHVENLIKWNNSWRNV